MTLLKLYGEMWPRNSDSINAIPGSAEGGQGVYVLYDGSTPVYIGKGNIRRRIRNAKKSARKGQLWDYFSWYIPQDKKVIHDLEILLLRLLPHFMRSLNRQVGHFQSGRPKRLSKQNRIPEYISRGR